MRHKLAPVAAALLLAAAVPAQNTFYVNGQTGLDQSGYGLSPGMPWKTIGHAMANATLGASGTATIFVEGNQVYSPSTNGETFPIVAAPGIWVEGTFVGHGRMPVLGIPAGGTGIRFDPARSYHRNDVTYRYLIFDGGAHGMTMGAGPGQRHRPRVQDCTFRNQARAGIRISQTGSRIDDPRFFQNGFTGPGRGIEILATGTGAIVQPDVEENRFFCLGGPAIDLDDRSPGGGNVGGIFRSNWFDNCPTGIMVRSSAGATTTNVRIRKSRFADIGAFAIDVLLNRPVDPSVTVEECAMLRCGGGVRLRGTPLPGTYTLSLQRNTMRSCNTGVEVNLIGQGNLSVTGSDNLIDRCASGVRVTANSSGSPAMQFAWRSERDRVLRCGSGVTISGNASGAVTWMSGMVCLTTGTAFDTSSSTLATTLRSATLADNGTGLRVLASGSGSAFDHLVFDGNGTDVAAPAPTLTYSCFANSSHPGTGNLNLTDPRLVRPFYKLSPSSPCRDAGNVAALLPATDYEGDPRAAVSTPGGAPLPDLGADEYLQTGSANAYGTGGFGTFNVFPRISSPTASPRIGSSVQIDLSGAIMPVFNVRATSAVLTFGWSDDSGALPFDLAPFGLSGSYLWNDLAASFPFAPVSTTGTASHVQNIPGTGALIGLTVTYQWFALMPSQHGIVASDGLRVTIGQ